MGKSLPLTSFGGTAPTPSRRAHHTCASHRPVPLHYPIEHPLPVALLRSDLRACGETVPQLRINEQRVQAPREVTSIVGSNQPGVPAVLG
jgi:hypothetical protein